MKPYTHLTSFCYTCPKCRHDVWITGFELGKENECYTCKVKFYADNLRVQIIHTEFAPTVIADSCSEPVAPPPPSKEIVPKSRIKAGVLDLLTNYGYGREEIEEAFGKVQCDNEDDYVREILKLL